MNAVMERFLRSVPTEVLDQVLVFDERRLERVLREYGKFFNGARPHQGLGQRIPRRLTSPDVRRERDRAPCARWPSPRLSPGRLIPRFSTDTDSPRASLGRASSTRTRASCSSSSRGIHGCAPRGCAR